MKYELLNDDLAKISLDNGKANPISLDLAHEIIAGFDRAEKEAKGVLLCGNPGLFSAGFDLKVIAESAEKAKAMFDAGYLMAERIYKHPQPVVVACEGHAIGMGVFILLSADYRVGAKGDFIIRLPETAINIAFDEILKIIAKNHIAPHHHSRAIIQSQPYSPDEATQSGMLDKTTDPEDVISTAVERLKQLCALPSEQYAVNKLNIRSDAISAIRQSLSE